MAGRIPTERELLLEIYRVNYDSFKAYSEQNKTRSTKIWVPINLEMLARKFRTDPDIIFGRLYYHLNEKYSHTASDGSKAEFFAIRIGGDNHCVNFPYLSSILGGLQDEQRKFVIATGIACISLLLSIVSIVLVTSG